MIIEKVLELKARRIKQWPVNSNRASQLGHECLRFLVLDANQALEQVVADFHELFWEPLIGSD